MSNRRYETSEVGFDERRDRDYARRTGSRYDDRQYDEEIEFRRSAPPVRERERERVREEIDIREERTRARDPPDFLRDDYGRTSAGPMVLRSREREDFEFAPRARRRSPSVESDRKVERESITIRRDRDEQDSRYTSRREKSRDREEIIIKQDKRERTRPAPPPPPPPPPPPEEVQREEIIIRREGQSRSRPPPVDDRETEKITITRRSEEDRGPRFDPPPRDDREVEKITITRRSDEDRGPRYDPPPRDDREVEKITITRRSDDDRGPRYDPPPRDDRETEQITITRRSDEDRGSRYQPPPPKDFDREEIIIRRNRDDDTRGYTAPLPPRDVDVSPRMRSYNRERTPAPHDDSESDREIIIRRDEIKGRGRDATRQSEEIIIRARSRSSSRSLSPAPSLRSTRSSRLRAAPEPQVVYAPEIHQEVITHHRHIDHGYEVAIPQRPRPVSRPPSPPSPPPPQPPQPPPPARDQSEERIEIHRSGERNGKAYDEDIIIDRNEGSRSVPPPQSSERYGPPARREPRWRDEHDVEEEAEYFNQRALERSYPGEAWHGATRDWGLVDIPPGTRKVRMDGAGGGAQEISWQRYNGMRRSKFYPETDDDEAYSSVELLRPAPPPAPRPEPLPAPGGDIGRRYGKSRDPKAGLWTEVTKDLVVKEAITEMGYEYEETDEFYYIIAYLKYDDIARLVGLSEDIRKDRRKRVKEIEWESRIEPEAPPAPRRPLAIGPPPSRGPRPGWEREDDRYIEREIVYRGGRPPPPPGWRR